ncbi:nbs-1 [Pristionchus pacificus]|uniref:FHA domain-containing protein n=1 Tax=Pristionchus pacificus TaxID=54126 RepID=A0A2A6BZ38_PRIPA|nr:nbs-1 [Pristionchus pacificus]|eukprot:PDM71148.1 hypothetical protein PRIPAC_43531 [Pristionchus pacificus]
MFRLVRATSRDITICAIDSSNTKAKIGRDPKTCTVQLGTKAVAVSREHADLNWNSGGVTLVDTSSFGTLVDGEKIIKSSKLLRGGERLKIGQEEFILEKIEEVRKETPRIQPLQQSNPTAKTSIASYFTKKSNVLQEESQAADVSIRKILATETPSESQESQKEPSQLIRKPVRGRAKRVNPLFDFDEEDEATMDIAKGRLLATETPSDSVPSPKETAPIAPPPVRSPQPNAVTQPNGTVEKRRKVSLFSKPSQRQKTHGMSKPAEDDEIIEVEMDVSPSNEGAISLLDDGFVRPIVPPSRSRTTTPSHSTAGPSSKGRIVNRRDIDSMNISDDHLGVNASSIPTQVIPPVRKPVISSEIDGGFPSEPPRKKTKSLFEDYKKQQKKKESNKPKEKSLLDEDGIGEINIRYDDIRYDYAVAPKPMIGDRAYSSMDNLRAMEQMGKDAEARLNKKLGLDRMDQGEIQMPSVEELTSILCSSHTEDKVEEEKEGEVERVGHETLDDEIKSQLVTFCDSLVVSQPSFDSIASDNPSQGKGFKKFKKAKQGRFASQSAGYSGIIGGSDLVDFRQIQI